MSNRKGRPASRIPRLVFLIAAGFLGLAGSAAFLSHGDAQEAEVQITELACNANPELIVISNFGDTELSMTGWNLQSDPTGSQSLPLAQFGSLSPDETLMVEAGPEADGAFVWSTEFLFRDNDSTDFAQLASDAGDVLLKVNCGGAPQQTSSASPTALPVSNAPAGGGLPGGGSGVSPAILIALGSGVFTAGLGTLALPVLGRFRRRAPSADAEPDQEPPAAALAQPAPEAPLVFDNPPNDVNRRGKQAASEDMLRPYLFLAVIVLSLIAALVFVLQMEESKRK